MKCTVAPLGNQLIVQLDKQYNLTLHSGEYIVTHAKDEQTLTVVTTHYSNINYK